MSKKLGFILLIISCVATGCTREFVCQCTASYSGIPGLPNPVVQDYIIKDTKENAKKKCASYSSTVTNNGITTKEDCQLY